VTPRNQTEDLNVKVFEEATDGVSASGCSNRKITATHYGRSAPNKPVGYLNADSFAAGLDRAIMRSGKLIEAKAVEPLQRE
jgi:hypothetical protein